MFNKVLGQSFGFEKVEVGIKQTTNRINDSVFRLKGQMEHFKVSAMPRRCSAVCKVFRAR